MELKATSLGKHLAQHPYNRVTLLNAGVNVAGDKHEYLIPFNQLIAVNCKRGLVWGELEFVLPDNNVVRLHGTEWGETQRFYRHLSERWQTWSQSMSDVAARALDELVAMLNKAAPPDQWLRLEQVERLANVVRHALAALPLPHQRIPMFENCREAWQHCLTWLSGAAQARLQHNQQYAQTMRLQFPEFFEHIEQSPLNISQASAVVNGEKNVLVLAGAGSGKTSVLVARAGWLLERGEARPEQILLLAFGRKAAEEMADRIATRLHTPEITAQTFHALALHILQEGGRKTINISQLETDTAQRQAFLLTCWAQQCSEKKAQAKGWRQWLEDDLGWSVPEGAFWDDIPLRRRLAVRLDAWLGLLRMHGGTQAEMVASAAQEDKDLFQKRIRLMGPILKAWKKALKEEGAVDFPGLILQAINVLEKKRFISPWKCILVDEFQDLSPQRAALLKALMAQNPETSLYAVGDDWQAIYHFTGAALNLTTAFHTHFGEGDLCVLDTTYRFNTRIGEIANAFIQQNPSQLRKTLRSLAPGDKNAVTSLPEAQLSALLDKMSGYVPPDATILILGRYHHRRPALLEQAATRWPNLAISFMTIHACKGREADYVIVCGMDEGTEGFPAPSRESVMETVLLPAQEPFPDAEERRLLYVALTRAKQRVWLLYNPEQPSRFIGELNTLGVPIARKP